jgi:hypothetical protein
MTQQTEEAEPKKLNRNNPNYEMRLHYRVGSVAACNSFAVIPNLTDNPEEINCSNCKKWLDINGAQHVNSVCS